MKTSFIVLAGVALVTALQLSAQAAEPKFDFQLDDLAGQSHVQMGDFESKPLIVHVWAPECPQCERNMPYFKSMADSLDTGKVNLVACSMGNQRETASYVDAHKLGFKVLYSGHTKDFISKGFTADGWPTSFVFAPGGELIGTCDAQGVAYQSRMRELIDKAVSVAEGKRSDGLRDEVKSWIKCNRTRSDRALHALAPSIQVTRLHARTATRLASRRAKLHPLQRGQSATSK